MRRAVEYNSRTGRGGSMRELENLPFEQSRERIIDILKDLYTKGDLELDDFEKRMNRINASTSKDELIPLIRDLPIPAESSPPSPLEPAEGTVRINQGHVQESGFILSVLSGNTRKGPWKPPRQLRNVTVMGGTELDFREAQFPPGITDVTIFCLMGGVEIRVPHGINIEVHGVGIMVAFEDATSGETGFSGPTLRVGGFALMGGVEIKHKSRKRKD